MEEDHSSDSGSNGLIDVTNMTSSSEPFSDKSSGDKEKEPPHKQRVQHSAERGWSTIGSSLNGIGFLQDEEFDCEVPEEFLDVSCESDQEPGQDSSRGEEEENEEEEEEEEEEDKEGGGDVPDGPQPQMCVWVPPECCLIPLPESPVMGSDDEGEREEKEQKMQEAGNEKGGSGGGVRGIVRVLSESELQRQCEKELEDLLGFKPVPPPPPPPPTSPSSPKLRDGGDAGVRERGNKRSNSTDSGVSGVGQHSMEGDMELRHDQNGMETVGRGKVREDKKEEKEEVCSVGDARNGDGGKGQESVTPERPLQQRPASRLKTPSEKLRKCSVFSGSPVICSELEILKEASKMAHLPTLPLPTSSAHDTFIVDCPAHSTLSSASHSNTMPTHTNAMPTHTSATAPNAQDSRDCVAAENEQSGGERGSDSSSSTTSGCSSSGSRETGPTRKSLASKRISRSRLSKLASHTAFAYKASTGGPPLKVKKPTTLKSLLPAAGVSGAPPLRIRKPDTSATRKDRGGESQLAPPGKMVAPTGKMAVPPLTKSTGFIKPGQRMARKSSDPGPVAAKDTTAASKHLSNETFSVVRGVARAGKGPTKPTKATTQPNPTHPSSSPARVKGSPKLPGKLKTPVVATTPQAKRVTNCGDSLSTSILSTCSPSVQQSTPMRRGSDSAVRTRRGATVVKEREVGGGGGGVRAGEGRGSGEGGVDVPLCTPKNVVGLTPNRVRPKFSLSSIESEPSCPRPVAVGETFTLPRDTQPAADSTPKSARKKRRSFIPTPIRQENNGRKHREIPLLTYGTDKKSSPPQAQSSAANQGTTDVGCSPIAAPEQKSRMPPPKTRRPLVSRNKMAAGAWRQQVQKENKGPLKPMNTYKYAYRSFSEDSEPPITAAKVVHSPVNKENQQPSPHSEWSPVRRKVMSGADACFQCTKRGFRNNL